MYTNSLPWYIVVPYIITLILVGLYTRFKTCPLCAHPEMMYDWYYTTDGTDPYWFEVRKCDHCNLGQHRPLSMVTWYDGLTPYD